MFDFALFLTIASNLIFHIYIQTCLYNTESKLTFPMPHSTTMLESRDSCHSPTMPCTVAMVSGSEQFGAALIVYIVAKVISKDVSIRDMIDIHFQS